MSFEVKRLGRFARLVTEKSESADFKLALEHVEGWTGRLATDPEAIASGSEELGSEGIRFRSGDVLFGKLRPYLAKAWVADRVGAAVGDFHVYRPSRDVHPRFLLYSLIRSEYIDEVNASTYGSKMPRASWDYIKGTRHHLPELPEQRRIAEFLDRETAQIDELIAKQEQLVSTLAERLSALRTELFDPSSSKHLGRSWEWREVRLKHVVRGVDQGVSPEASAELADESSWGVLKSGCVNRGVFNPLEHKRLDADFHVDPRHVVRIGDFIVNRASGSPDLVGSAAVVNKLGFNLILSDKTFRLRLNGLASSAYLENFMQSRWYREQVLAAISGAGGLANNLPLTALKNFAVPLAPSATQAWIAETLDKAASAHRTATVSAERAVELLRERRQALISAAVTGLIDAGGASL